MKRIWILSALAIMVLAPQLSADTVYLNRINGYYSGNGGEFSLTPSSGLAWVLSSYDSSTLYVYPDTTVAFQTFCVEDQEYVNVPGTYTAIINDRAMMGGNPPNGDPLSVGTAWLYHLFQSQQLTNYDWTPGAGRAVSAALLQNTIWWLEDEVVDPGAGNVFRNMVIAKFGSAALAKADNNGQYDVRVLNLYNLDGSLAQDQLVCAPDGGLTLILLGIGFGVVALISRRLLN
jgi:hypothetical protein